MRVFMASFTGVLSVIILRDKMIRRAAFLVVATLMAATLLMAQPSTSNSQQENPNQLTGRYTPQARTLQEYADFNPAYSITGGASAEKAAREFAAKHPTSELRAYLYSKALHDYQKENNTEKMLAMGGEVLTLDPDNSIALVLTASVIADSLSDADPDRDQKIARIKGYANRALETIDTSFMPPPGATPEQIMAYKNSLRSMAHSALGIMKLKNKDYQGAEADLVMATELNKAEADPYVLYHLALALDHQKKYKAALVSAEQGLKYTDANPELERLLRSECARLFKLVSPSKPKP